MVELIEFPTNSVAEDALPQPGDAYEAFGLAHRIKPVSLAFIFSDWSIKKIPYGPMGIHDFIPLGDDASGDGE
jgi:hypothetical protein